MSKKSRRKRSRSVHARSRPSPAISLAARTRSFILGLLPVLAIVVVTRETLAEAYRIPSGSMEPTVRVGDWLFVNKLRYGPHIPFTQHSLPGYAEPQRGDVAVFTSPPQDPSIRMSPDDVTPVLVKRIVGVGGDTLLMRHGTLFVNGSVVAPRNVAFTLSDDVADRPQPLFAWEHGIEARGSRFGEPIANPSLHEWGPLVIPAGMFFMMGDNRDDSVDSRYYGLVPRANLLGTPMMVYYSYDPEAGVDYLRAVTAIRWRRLGTWIR